MPGTFADQEVGHGRSQNGRELHQEVANSKTRIQTVALDPYTANDREFLFTVNQTPALLNRYRQFNSIRIGVTDP